MHFCFSVSHGRIGNERLRGETIGLDGIVLLEGTRCPTPHGIGAPPGCLLFSGGVVLPEYEAILNPL